MKNRIYLFSCIALAIAACTPEKKPSTNKPDPEGPIVEKGFISDSVGIHSLWNKRFKDEANGFTSVKDIKKIRWTVDGKTVNSYKKHYRNASSDLRYEFYNENAVRFVSESDGYAVTFPLKMELEPNFELAKYAQRFESEDVTLRLTLEKVTPYPATEHYYGIYTGEWLDRFISDKNFIDKNNLKYYEPTIKNDESIIEGYSVNIYSIFAKGLEKPYYKIALARPLGQWSKFGFIVFKGKTTSDVEEFDAILKSFRVISGFGKSKNYLSSQVAKPNPKWNEETSAYYQKLLSQKTFDFGVFSASMPSDDDETLESQRERIRSEKERLEKAFGRPYDIMPTYTHISWYSYIMGFPNILAKEFAQGNGFNSKPVLQFTYQFTNNNNNVAECQTPMFDILRGKYDDLFHKLAKDIKAYSHPVLFRLNNEMNSDWTSYCGMMTLCDPEVFIQTWRYLYNIFEAEGVDNCIWIFNPIAVSCPYSKWGENLAYYPGNDYVQALGVTNYEMGNDLPMTSFRDRYTDVFNTNKDLFSELPWIISEFACGSGGATSGEEMRNGKEQAEWVKGMFTDFINYDANPYLHPLKGGVWFSANDYSGEQTTNYLKLDEHLTETLDAFAWGFEEMYKKD